MSTRIIINNNKVIETQITGIASISYNYLGDKIYSASQYEKIYGVFVSSEIDAGINFLKWNQISWDSITDEFSKLYLFVKSSDTKGGLMHSSWSNVILSSPADISQFKGRYIQFMVLIKIDNDNFSVPKVEKVNLSYFSKESSVKFFTKTFNLGFAPKHVLLTYNSNIDNIENDDVAIRFAISGEDSVDTSKYQYINPNKIEKLSDIPKTSKNIKVMLEIFSSSEAQVIVNEFGLMFSGEDPLRINKLEKVSSSSSSSSFSSFSSSSSSSSIDSSSSSSLGNSSSSSSLGNSSSSSSIDSSSSSSSSSIDSSSSSSSSLVTSSSSSSSSLVTSSSSSSESSEDVLYYAEGFGFPNFNGVYLSDGISKFNGRRFYINQENSNVRIYWSETIWKITDGVNDWYYSPVTPSNPHILYEGQWSELGTSASPGGYISSVPFSSSSGL